MKQISYRNIDEQDKIRLLREKIEAADTIVVGGSSGMSGEMAEWVRSPYFLQGKDYEREFERYMDFLRSNMNKRVLFLELGVGMILPHALS